MEYRDRPNLGPETFEQIESEMHFQDKRFWKELRALQMPTPLGIKFQALFLRDGPTPPALPVRLSNVISNYGLALIEVEASKYPKLHNDSRRWMIDLTKRVENRVINLIESLETRDPFLSLNHHGLSRDDLLQVLRKDAEWAIGMYSFGSSSTECLSPPTEAAAAQTPLPQPSIPDIEPEVMRRRALLEEYKAETHASHKSIYEAKNSIHKPQFFEWLNGKLPSHSATTKNFERFLTAKKAPIPRKPKR